MKTTNNKQTLSTLRKAFDAKTLLTSDSADCSNAIPAQRRFERHSFKANGNYIITNVGQGVWAMNFPPTVGMATKYVFITKGK